MCLVDEGKEHNYKEAAAPHRDFHSSVSNHNFLVVEQLSQSQLI